MANVNYLDSAVLTENLQMSNSSTNKADNHEDNFIKELLDNQDLKLIFHISDRTLQTLRSNGTLPYTRLGRKIFYKRSDIERVLKRNYRSSPPLS